jgi:hypothetical protein
MARAQRLRNEALMIRRSRILELLSQGYTSVTEIARKLNLPRTTTNRDIEYIKNESRKRLETHIQDEIPFIYMRTMEGINKILRMGHEIADRPNIDDKTKLQALQLLTMTYKSMLDISADGTVVQSHREDTGDRTSRL